MNRDEPMSPTALNSPPEAQGVRAEDKQIRISQARAAADEFLRAVFNFRLRRPLSGIERRLSRIERALRKVDR